jgi:hypothetical protein
LILASQVAAQEVQLETDTAVANAGYFQLRWNASSAVELEESTTPDFTAPRRLYSGSDRARVVSGKPDGDWYYRARPVSSGSSFSNIVKVEVRHHPLKRAVAYFVVGAVVFLATALLIVNGARERI